jgi:hypothetical protein
MTQVNIFTRSQKSKYRIVRINMSVKSWQSATGQAEFYKKWWLFGGTVRWYDNPENSLHHTTLIPPIPHPGCGTCGTGRMVVCMSQMKEINDTTTESLMMIGAQQTQWTAQHAIQSYFTLTMR